ncbi:glycosyltransferase [Paenibacillus chitinolyticus]|uniref:glycosyltransferase n=1 Tax=Paenibacillus chitinolyticus TaxID=79263 RepID=UPI00365EBFAD
MKTNSKLKVAFFITSLAGGGAEKAVSMLLDSLCGVTYELHLIVNKLEGPYVKSLPEHIHVTELGAARLRSALPVLKQELKKINPDVVISHMMENNLLIMLAKLTGKFSFKTLLCEHSTIQRKRFKGANMLRTWTYSRSDGVIGVSAAMGQEIHSVLKVPENKVHVIYNPVFDSDFIQRSERPCTHPWLIDMEYPVIIGIGRLVREKRFDLFIEVIKELNEGMNVRAIILGEGHLRSELQEKINGYKLQAKVELAGYMDNPLPFLKKGNVFLQSSDIEGLPTALIEATACGIPIVATKTHTGTEEILNGGSGIIVEREDVNGMVDAVKLMLQQQRSEVSPTYYQKFSSEQAAEEYSSLIDKLCI